MIYDCLMPAYAAFLRGINVGGNKKVPMKELAAALEKVGFKNVKTLLNSGNVLLESSEKSGDAVARKVEGVIEKTFGFGAHTIVRSLEQLKELSATNPFKGIKETDDTRFYITLLSSKTT